jgi:ectoine hydroxylase-related dioxygenase (phytanoyl-CoA dioxygenase family)
MMHVPAELVERFDRDGFVLMRDVLDAGELAALRAETDRLLEFSVNAHLAAATDPAGGRLQAAWRGDVLIARIMQPVIDVSPPFAGLVSRPRMLETLGAVLRDEAVFAHDKIVYKQAIPQLGAAEHDLFEEFPAGYSEAFVPHTDAGWYTAEDGYPENAVTFAAFLDDSAGRGPLAFLPGSHRRRYPYFRGGDIATEHIPAGSMHEVPAAAGDILVFDARTVHSSGRNDSGLPRRIFMATYCPQSAFTEDPDRRSRRKRERAEAIEARYRAQVASGAYADRRILASTGSAR